jgi:hypothetical protein
MDGSPWKDGEETKANLEPNAFFLSNLLFDD